MMDQNIDDYPGIKISTVELALIPFLRNETRLTRILDDVMVPSMSLAENLVEKPLFSRIQKNSSL